MKIVIKIDEDSNTSAETFDSTGIECIEKLNQILGDLLEIDMDEIKPDYYKNKIVSEEKNTLKNE